jgi:LPXTG-motif cell wall-anchored protein
VLGIIAVLLVLWLVVAVLGAVLEGLFWLTVIGLVLFLATAAWGWAKRRTVR